MRSGFADLKSTLVLGFRSLPSRESSGQMIRLLREGNRLHEERLPRRGLGIRKQQFEIQQALRGIADGVQVILEGQRALHEDIRALIVRIDALMKGRADGSSAA